MSKTVCVPAPARLAHRPVLAAAILMLCLMAGLALSPTTGWSQGARPAAPAGPDDARFKQFSDQFLAAYWRQLPVEAVSQGLSTYDSSLPAPTAAYRAQVAAFARKTLTDLAKFQPARLGVLARMDHAMIGGRMRQILFEIDTLRSWSWDPSHYNATGDFSEILQSKTRDNATKMRMLAVRLRRVPAYYEAAKANLENPTKEHTALAIEQNEGGVAVFERELPAAFRALPGLPEAGKARLVAQCQEAAKAVRGYVAHLKTLPNAQPRSVRLGPELYERRFALVGQTSVTARQAYENALARKSELHGKMYELSLELFPQLLSGQAFPSDSLTAISAVINHLSRKHVDREGFQAAVERQIPQLAAFVKEKDLLTQDASKPLTVRREPAYMAGVAGASISAPGPYDKAAETFYNVGSLAKYTPAEAESFLREYNDYTLQILNIHEAIPGHYTQLVYANRSPSIIKAVFGNGHMVEGWAVYAERMMLDAGYGGGTPEMMLMYYKWHLRAVCNTILDYSVHNLEMTERQAMDLLQRQAFQQTTEAKGKWRRAQLTSVQLTSYYVGYDQIMALREKVRERQGDKFSLKAFHEQFLSYGSAPVPLIAQAMLQ